MAPSDTGEVRLENGALMIETGDGAPVRAATRSIERRRAAMPMIASAAVVGPEGVGILSRERVRERIVAFDAHTSQSWSFDAVPAGEGPLLVRVRIEGARYRSMTSEGLVLDVDGRTVLYGHGAFVDARGTRTPVRARWSDGDVVLEVAETLLVGATYPVTLDPTIRVESGIDAPVYGSDRNIQSHPAVATTGTQSLVVWSDYRTGRSYDVFGVRLDAAGARLEAGSFPIALAAKAQWRPSVAATSSGYFVVWEDHRDGGSAIYGARVSTAGVVLDEDGILLSDAAAAGSAPKVASDGTDYLVVWERQEAGGKRTIRGTRVTGAGVASASFSIGSGGVTNLAPSVAYGGTTAPHFVVGWEQQHVPSMSSTSRFDVVAARVTAEGVVVDATSIAVTASVHSESQVSVAVAGTIALVCYRRASTSGDVEDADIECRSLSLADAALGPITPVLADAAIYDTPTVVAAPGIGFSVFASRVTSVDAGDVGVYVLDPSGNPLTGPFPVATGPGTQNAPCAVALASGASLIVLQSDDEGSTEIYGHHVPAGSPPSVGRFRLSSAAVRQDGVDVAWGGSSYFAVWHDARTDAGSVLGARVMADGTVLDDEAIALSTSSGPALEPAVAGGDGVYLAVWRELGRVVARRVTASGQTLDAAPLTVRVGHGLARPDVAWNGTHFFVVWEEYVGGNYDIYGRRYAPNGSSPDASPVRISKTSERSASASVTSDGVSFQLAWIEDDKRVVCTKTIETSGVLAALDALTVATAGVGTFSDVSASFGEGRVLMVWASQQPGAPSSVRARSVDLATGTFDVERPVASDTVSQRRPRVAFGGEDFLVAWERETGSENRDLRVRRVDETGAPNATDPNVEPISETLLDERGAALVSAGASRWLLGFERFDASDMFGNVRARLRFVDGGEGCVDDGECTSGQCVDGACCDTACGGGAFDCMACSVAGGAEEEGTCGPLVAGVASRQICRDVAGACDAAETCSASSVACPTDEVESSSTVCRASTHLCDDVDYCDGTSASCPAETSPPVCPPGDLAISVTDVSTQRALMPGTYTISVANVGDGPTTGTVVVTQVLPSSITLVSVAPSVDWSCSIVAQTATCTHTGVVWDSVTLSALVFTVIPDEGISSVSYPATLMGAEGDENATNDVVSIELPICEPNEASVECPCPMGYVPVSGTCELFVSCDSLDCEAANRPCSESPNGHCLEACFTGYVWDGALGACRAPLECSELSCAYGCTPHTSSADAYCNAGLCPSGAGVDMTNGLCSPCTGGATTCSGTGMTGRRLLADGAGSSCLCETVAGYFFDQQTTSVVACDHDDDGFTTARVIDELSSTTQSLAPQLTANARCAVRYIDRVELVADEGGASRTVMVGSTVPLYETAANDGEGAGPKFPDTSGLEIPARARNSFTKACIPPPGDVNGNGLPDVHEGGGMLPSGHVGDAATYFAIYTRFSYYFELDVGYYVAPSSGTVGRYRIVERDRSTTGSTGAAGIPFDVDTTATYGTYWRECGRSTDRDTAPGVAPLVGSADFVEFAETTGPNAWAGMDHASQFKCVHYVPPAAYDAGVAPATGPVSTETFPQIVTWDPLGQQLRRTSRAGSPVDEHHGSTVALCSLTASYQTSGIDLRNPDTPTFDCDSTSAASMYTAGVSSWTGWMPVGYENAGVGTDPGAVAPSYRRGCVNECAVLGPSACGDPGTYCLMTPTNQFGHLMCAVTCAPGEYHADTAPSSSHDYAMCGATIGSAWTTSNPRGQGGTYTLRGHVDITGVGAPTNGTTVSPTLSGGTYTVRPR